MKVIAEVDYKADRECPVWALLFDNKVHNQWTITVDDGKRFRQFLESEVTITDRSLEGFEFFTNPDGVSFLVFSLLIDKDNLYDHILVDPKPGAYQEFREKLIRMSPTNV